MSENEKIELIHLLGLRRKELNKELQTNDYSDVLSVERSKQNQISYINELIVQLV